MAAGHKEIIYFSMATKAVGTHKSERMRHAIVTDKSTLFIKTDGLGAAGTIQVKLYSAFNYRAELEAGTWNPNTSDMYWNLVETVPTTGTLSASDFTDLDGDGKMAYHESIGHPIAPNTIIQLIVAGNPIDVEVGIMVGI